MSAQFNALDIDTAMWTLESVDSNPLDVPSPSDICDQIKSLKALPPLPEIARRIIALNSDPLADNRKLAKIIELSPSLSAQVIRWASSALYGFRGKLSSVADSITKVLGYEQVLNLGLSIAAVSPLQSPAEGPLGTRFFWRQALVGTVILQKLVKKLPVDKRTDFAQLQLIYLLHNTGYLLLSHLYPKEFKYLTSLIKSNPQIPFLQLERFALSVDHTQLGIWLMEAWNMPEALQVVTQHHHNPNYRGAHENIVQLVCLTNGLLGRIGIGDEIHGGGSISTIVQKLEIEPEEVDAILSEISEKLNNIEITVAQLTQTP